MRTKTTIGVLVVVVLFYAALIGFKGVGLLAGDSLVGRVLGVALLVLPLLGLLLVWREIEFGRRTAVLARELGDEPTLARKVGGAVGRNPLSVVVPCHRVVGKDGKLTGYAGGLERKRFLLDLEAQDQRLL